jgi:hypothetical protein
MRMNTRTLLRVIILFLVLPASATFGRAEANQGLADEVSSKVASAWFELFYDVVKAVKMPPPLASRVYGVTAVALYESVAGGSKESRSLVGQLNDLKAVPQPVKDASYHWPSVANSALANTIRGLYPTISPNMLGRVNGLEQKLDAEYRGQMGAKERDRASAHGRAVSQAILAWAATDGFAAHNNCRYLDPQSVVERWRPTPPALCRRRCNRAGDNCVLWHCAPGRNARRRARQNFPTIPNRISTLPRSKFTKSGCHLAASKKLSPNIGPTIRATPALCRDTGSL